MKSLLTYENDGRCHNAEAGSYSHECGQPAVWIGEKYNGFRAGYCDHCRHFGYEARDVVKWERTTERRQAYIGRGIEVRADFREASAPITYRPIGDEEWRPTPYQVADATHQWSMALDLVKDWCEAQA